MLLDGGKEVSILQGQSARPCDKVLPAVLSRYVESLCRAGRDRKYFLDRRLLEQDSFHPCCQATQSLRAYRKGESFPRFAIDPPHWGRQQDSFGSRGGIILPGPPSIARFVVRKLWAMVTFSVRWQL